MNVKVPCSGSVASHFILFPGVICPKYAAWSRIAVYAVSVSSGLSVALPKYNFPAALATVLVNAVEVPMGKPPLPVGVLEGELVGGGLEPTEETVPVPCSIGGVK